MKKQGVPKSPGRTARRRRLRARAGFLIAFAFLAGGVVGGAAWHPKELAWVFPVGGVVAFVFAFGQALRAGQPEGIDELWRWRSSTAGTVREKRPFGWLPDRQGRGKADAAGWDVRKGKGTPWAIWRRSDTMGSRGEG